MLILVDYRLYCQQFSNYCNMHLHYLQSLTLSNVMIVHLGVHLLRQMVLSLSRPLLSN